jgi:hypothetical protein
MNRRKPLEISEQEVSRLLRETFGKENVARHRKVNGKKPDFQVKVNNEDVYVEVRTIKDIANKLTKFSPTKDTPDNLRKILHNGTNFRLDAENRNILLDKIRGKILEKCEQLPDGKQNVLILKGEGFLVSPDKIIDAIAERIPQIDKTTMNVETKIVSHFRTEDEAREALKKISAIIVYKEVCQHGKLRGIFGNNEKNAEIPLTEMSYRKFSSLRCNHCAP